MNVLLLLLLLASPVSAKTKDAGTASQPVAKVATHMVARMWRGRVPTSRADEYEKYLYDSGILKIRTIAGNLGAEMLRRQDGDITEFIVISYWPNREAIKAFAGQDIEKAHFLPRDREFLINPDEFVRHYDATSAP
ncbi:MAG TPA: antibiotic biosynthesis monooxygenase [Thermoanaerobaculia bacterium]|jgi:heme-degrading monooxygenase HmoA|nr:antibiotic biosynthesis monooxygenase [Thermoanaerobaculia bacterium]